MQNLNLDNSLVRKIADHFEARLRGGTGQMNVESLKIGAAKSLGLGRVPDQGIYQEAIDLLVREKRIKAVRSGKGHAYRLVDMRPKEARTSFGDFKVSYEGGALRVSVDGHALRIMRDPDDREYFNHAGHQFYLEEDGLYVEGEFLCELETPAGKMTLMVTKLKIVFGLVLIAFAFGGFAALSSGLIQF